MTSHYGQNLDSQIWKSRISTSTKLKLYNTCILLIFLYGSECWAVTKRDVHKIDALGQLCLRKLLGIKWYHYVRNDAELADINVNAYVDGHIYSNNIIDVTVRRDTTDILISIIRNVLYRIYRGLRGGRGQGSASLSLFRLGARKLFAPSPSCVSNINFSGLLARK